MLMLACRAVVWGFRNGTAFLALSNLDVKHMARGESIIIERFEAVTRLGLDARFLLVYGEDHIEIREALAVQGIVLPRRGLRGPLGQLPDRTRRFFMTLVAERIKKRNEGLREAVDKLDHSDPVCRSIRSAGEKAEALGAEMMRRAEEGAPGWDQHAAEPIVERFDGMVADMTEAASAAKVAAH